MFPNLQQKSPPLQCINYFLVPKGKGKGFPILDTKRWARSWSRCTGSQPQVTVSHPPGGRLPLLSARHAVTSPAAEHHRPFAGTKLYCLVTEAHRCEQLAQGCYAALSRVGFEPAIYWSQVRRSTVTLSGAYWVYNAPLQKDVIHLELRP